MLTPISGPETMPAKSIFPIAYGNEEETGLMDDTCGVMEEPYRLTHELRQHLDPALLGTDKSTLIFLRNGFKVYPGGSIDQEAPTNIERATPECTSPDQLVLYMRASELLLTKLVGSYLTLESGRVGGPLQARIQRRVVDSSGSRKACHDNYGVAPDSILATRETLPYPVLTHLVTRSFVTGAGHVEPGGLRYAQKIDGLLKVKYYGYGGSVYWRTIAEGSPRFEVRCSDINISDWAASVRIGAMACALALSQTPLARNLAETIPSSFIQQARLANRIKLNDDGSIVDSAAVRRAVDFQQAQADLTMGKLHAYADVPSDLYRLAKETYEFCDDFKKVLGGDASIRLLADRADWAAKLSIILSRKQRDESYGMKRTLTDMKSRASDMRYDYIGLAAFDGQLDTVDYGLGFKLRQKGFFRNISPQLTDMAVETAYRRPPKTTRASLRSDLLRQYHVVGADWHKLRVEDEETYHDINFPDVLQTELSAEDAVKLADVKKLRP